ncbi:MAG TPA: imidazoleglycerol-phosphate dehydratase HisB [Calditrichia bacterium]|nr:imidazoleglycerol-phosphate dehydratase HisB [Calditrichia bacterium]
MRTANITRETRETQISISLDLDGTGKAEIDSPLGFLNHMLDTLARHGAFDLKATIRGDLEVDQHHTVEDCGIVLGEAFKAALGDKRGIRRAGFFIYPMDESLAQVALDLSGRPYLRWEVPFANRTVGELELALFEDFFLGLTNALGINLHISVPYGRSDHHKIEAVFKAFTKAMRMACEIDPRTAGEIPSTKGVI